MKKNIRLVIYPILLSVLFFGVALSPVDLLGSKMRGLLAFAIALVSGTSGVVTGVKAVNCRVNGNCDSPWWILRTCIFAIPVAAVLVLA